MNPDTLWETTMDPDEADAAAGERRGPHRSRPDVHDAHGRSGRAAPEVHRRQRARRQEPGHLDRRVRIRSVQIHDIPVNIEDEMKRSYMDYAMSVIIGRALPDVRDGLKPANRRVLFAMRQMGLASNRAVPQVREDRRRSHRQLPSARRRAGVRHARPSRAGLQHALPPGRRPGQLRLGRRRSAGGVPLHGSASRVARRSDDDGPRQGHRRLPADLRRNDRRARRAADAVPEPAGQRIDRHRRRHGDEHSAAQHARGHRRRDRA